MSRTMEPMTSAPRHPGLPAGYVDRAGSLDDLPAAMEICELNERRVIDDTTGFARHFRIFWTSPETDITRDLRVIENTEGETAGFAHVRVERPYVQARFMGYVHPDHYGMGLGTFLAEWAENRARQIMERAPGGVRTSMHQGVVAGDELAGALLRAHGFEITRHFVFMVIDFDGPPQPPVWPEGVELRPVDWKEHGRLISAADNEIFQDHWGFVPRSDDDAYAHMRHWFENDPDVDPTLWFVA
ncbi:MAG: GNAT family N-acetyltransferase, partial [Phycisphaerales bacterium]